MKHALQAAVVCLVCLTLFTSLRLHSGAIGLASSFDRPSQQPPAERFLYFWSPDPYKEGACSNAGVSHSHKNFGCTVQLANLTRRTLIYDDTLRQSPQHTKCGEALPQNYSSFFDLAGLGIRVVAASQLLRVGSAPAHDRLVQNLAALESGFPLAAPPDGAAFVDVGSGDEGFEALVATRAPLLVVTSEEYSDWCNFYWVCESRLLYSRTGPPVLPAAPAIRRAARSVAARLGANFSGVHLRQGDRLTDPMEELRVPVIDAQHLYGQLSAMLPPSLPSGGKAAVFVATDAPSILGERPWAQVLSSRYEVWTIRSFEAVLQAVSGHYRKGGPCMPYEVAWLEQLVLARAWRFLSTESSTFDDAVQVLRQQRARAIPGSVDLSFFGLASGAVGDPPLQDWGVDLASHWETARVFGHQQSSIVVVDGKRTALARQRANEAIALAREAVVNMSSKTAPQEAQ